LIEATFKIVAIATDETVAHDYASQNVRHRRKLAGKLEKVKGNPQDDSELITEVKSTLGKRIQDEEIADRTTEWFAGKAGLADFYNSAYAVLSEVAHVNVGTVDSFLVLDSQKNAVSLRYGFSDYRYVFHVLTAAEALLFCLKAVFAIVSASEDNVAKINAAHGEFEALFDQQSAETFV
jgi:hypothetical protein